MDREQYVAEKMFETLVSIRIHEMGDLINYAMQPELFFADRDFIRLEEPDMDSLKDMIHESFKNKSGVDMYLSLGYKMITQKPFGEDSAFIGAVLVEYEAKRHGLNIEKDILKDVVLSCLNEPSEERGFIDLVHTMSQDKGLALVCR